MKTILCFLLAGIVVCASASAYEPIEELKPRAETGDAEMATTEAASDDDPFAGIPDEDFDRMRAMCEASFNEDVLPGLLNEGLSAEEIEEIKLEDVGECMLLQAIER